MNQCDSQRHDPPDDCQKEVAVIWVCRIEGREVRMCRPCYNSWRATAREYPMLALRCPNCAPEYFSTRTPGPRVARTGSAHMPPYKGPLADAFDRAMCAEGVAANTRQRVLSRLGADEDPYIASLLRSVALSGEKATV